MCRECSSANAFALKTTLCFIVTLLFHNLVQVTAHPPDYSLSSLRLLCGRSQNEKLIKGMYLLIQYDNRHHGNGRFCENIELTLTRWEHLGVRVVVNSFKAKKQIFCQL